VLALPLWAALRLAGGGTDGLDDLPGLVDRIRQPVVCQVPPDGLRYLRFCQGWPHSGCRFAVVQLRLEARLTMGFPLVPGCFRLVDDRGAEHYPLSRSPLFVEHGALIGLERGTVVSGQLLFEIPEERTARNLLFARYRDNQ
jgi:hypothetical protein